MPHAQQLAHAAGGSGLGPRQLLERGPQPEQVDGVPGRDQLTYLSIPVLPGARPVGA